MEKQNQKVVMGRTDSAIEKDKETSGGPLLHRQYFLFFYMLEMCSLRHMVGEGQRYLQRPICWTVTGQESHTFD